MKSPAAYHHLALSYQEFIKMECNISNSEIGDYQIYQKLGGGAFGQVYKGFNKKTSIQVAVKVVDLHQIKQEKIASLREIKLRLCKNEDKIMQMCDSPYLVKCFDVYENQDLKIIVMQFCNRGTLDDYIQNKKKIPEQEAKLILKHILNGIAELHTHNIVHRDLKAENILIHNNTYKIADFGFSRKLDTQGVTSLGTLPLMAPQILARKRYGLKVDIWSVGVIFFHMLFGEYPFQKTNKPEILLQIQRTDLMKKTNQVYKKTKLSKQAYDFLKVTLVIDPNQRIGWKEIINHPILKKNQSKISRIIFDDAPVIGPSAVHDSYLNPEEMQFPSGLYNGSQMVRLVKKLSNKIPKPNEGKQSEEDKAFKWMDIKLYQCLKSELVFQEIIQKIQKYKLLNLEKREVIELMYLLSTRCFLDLSPIHHQMKNLKKKFTSYNNIYEAVEKLYIRLKDRWQHYQKVLTATQNQFLNKIGDFFSFSSTIEKKNKYMNGIQNVDYDKMEQLKYIRKEFINPLLQQIPQTLQSKKVKDYLIWYKEINQTSPEIYKKQGFDSYIEQLIQHR